ncbi:hypothetical protein ACUXZZ_45420 (plasmid) [Streptomyces graminifolii]|uniref:hypothetical protein n=1 Tax=Streptomyces graminifolii TaxID=1266771 RepID=UPI0040597A1A
MGRLGNFARSLKPGNDRELAAKQYAGRESATDRSARGTFGKPPRNTARAAQQGQEWEDGYWRRIPKTNWYRGQG